MQLDLLDILFYLIATNTFLVLVVFIAQLVYGSSVKKYIEPLQRNHESLLEKLATSKFQTEQAISTSVREQMSDIRGQLTLSFEQHANTLNNHLHHLTLQVNQRLNEGFDKTSATFSDVVKRLALIDEAQKKITELSSHVVSLQDVLMDKKARGAFGEVQLSALIANMMPKSSYALQYSLSNQKRVDCMLFLPEPTGHVAIDAKFPLEGYQKMMALDVASQERKGHMQQFRIDIQKHMKDIAEKYIIAGETADSAFMFIPAESIFAEIHANHPDLIALSQKLKVWLVSPTTLMAVLTTARAVLKDDATRKQIHIIQRHLHALSDDFQRFEKRMDRLGRHIDQAQQDVSEVSTSAKKIAARFHQIESVDLVLEDEEEAHA